MAISLKKKKIKLTCGMVTSRREPHPLHGNGTPSTPSGVIISVHRITSAKKSVSPLTVVDTGIAIETRTPTQEFYT